LINEIWSKHWGDVKNKKEIDFKLTDPILRPAGYWWISFQHTAYI